MLRQVRCGGPGPGAGTQYGWAQSPAGLLGLVWSQNRASLGRGGLGKDQELSSSELMRRRGLRRRPGLPSGAGRGMGQGSWGSSGAEGSGGALGGRGTQLFCTSSRHCTGTVEAAETNSLQI